MVDKQMLTEEMRAKNYAIDCVSSFSEQPKKTSILVDFLYCLRNTIKDKTITTFFSDKQPA